MNIERLVKQLEKDVGKSLRLYQDSYNNKLIGIGHLITNSDPEALRDIRPGQKISESKCTELLNSDLATAISDSVKIFGEDWLTFPEEFQESFTNLMFSTKREDIGTLKNIIVHATNRDWKLVKEAFSELDLRKTEPARVSRMLSKLQNL